MWLGVNWKMYRDGLVSYQEYSSVRATVGQNEIRTRKLEKTVKFLEMQAKRLRKTALGDARRVSHVYLEANLDDVTTE